MKALKGFLLLTLLFIGYHNTKADQPTLSTAFNNVINYYLDIKNALVAGDAATAQTKATAMLKAIGTAPYIEMNAEQRKVWDSYINKLTYDTRHISESPIDHQREHFAALSSNLMIVLKAFPLNTATLYKQYCPMKKLYWLSETNTIKNPYYGNTMLGCGTTKETFEANK